jgi:hypothetical protein
VDETYRMLGREHQADLEREALKWQRADALHGREHAPTVTPGIDRQPNRAQLALARFAALVGRATPEA